MPAMGHDHMTLAALHDTVGDVEIPQTPFDHAAAHHADGAADPRHQWGYHGDHDAERQRHAPWWFAWRNHDHDAHEGRHHRHPVPSADLVPATGVVVEHVKVVVDGTPADSDTLAAMAAAVIEAAQAELAQEVQHRQQMAEELQRQQQQREQHMQREMQHEQRKQQRDQGREQRKQQHEQRKQQREQEREQRRARHQ
ncbi:hypothetical protein AMAG_17383 [Allomyces macrogynus ATCC 38327]|uniref:Uncharacterized protein n=1 Tax=Allomyces macrogynus (strain ATCC 38327) TaxID=578462 RepID=A0A0L0TEV7_ALLM3|nr:hypothetical protein AMAG_17383 [Allomyces macrogynus ATCC 38327]|eukprot:KNE73191.1 hypothetical protein AMAG_17383 [Allomyces macrogynus ATCC 38327]